MKNSIHPLRLILKTGAIIALIALVILPVLGNSIGRVSLYNFLFPGRERFPYSEYPQQAYSLSLYNLDAMFASHQVTSKNERQEALRVFLLGDSATWGTLLRPEETLTGQLNALDLHTPSGRPVQFFNLGYPTLSLTKDLMLLDMSLDYEPDLVIWLLTLESFPDSKQLSSPLVQNNSAALARIYADLRFEPPADWALIHKPSYWDTTLFGQRRNLADIFRLQLYGVMWSITGIDQYYPADYETAARDLSEDPAFQDWEEGEMTADDLALEVLLAGREAAKGIPILYVNEPILLSSGLNSDIRYNFYYPRWAFDQYRQILADLSLSEGLTYLDLWNIVPEEAFTNTAIHTNPAGTRLLAESLKESILELLSKLD